MVDFIFQITDLCKSFAQHQVLKKINLNITRGDASVILGGSGTGKSVLIKSMIGLIQQDSGDILYEQQDVSTMDHSSRLKMLETCGYLFQSGALFDSLTVKENIVFFAKKIHSLNPKDEIDLASQKLQSVGLDTRILDLYPAELSGGMQKRVALARTICTTPKVIFFDEPTTGLDPIMSNVINDLIIKIREELNATTITITHDMNSARKIATDIAFLHCGEIIWSGKNCELNNADNTLLQQFITGVAK